MRKIPESLFARLVRIGLMDMVTSPPVTAKADYFAGLQAALRAAGIGWPVLVLDYERLCANARRLRALVGASQRLRLVEKSLPVPRLLDTTMELTGTNALMVFHASQLRQTAMAFPGADLLLGKPLPVAAARHFYLHRRGHGLIPERQLQWLVDTPQRLCEYAALAEELGTTLRISIEIDIGLHRGGVEDSTTMQAMLDIVRAQSRHLRLAGLMGYDAHLGKLPTWVQSRDRGFVLATAVYRSFQAQLCEAFPALALQACWNGAGSPTIALHGRGDSPLNDVSAGSLLLKPADFDLPLLADFGPALFIATPVLKSRLGSRLPGPDWFSRLLSGGRSRTRRSYFIYGGGWPARPVWPPGLRAPALYGVSYNQALLVGPSQPALQVDDWVFLRPHQSEGTLLQFGPIYVYAQRRIVECWEPFAEG